MNTETDEARTETDYSRGVNDAALAMKLALQLKADEARGAEPAPEPTGDGSAIRSNLPGLVRDCLEKVEWDTETLAAVEAVLQERRAKDEKPRRQTYTEFVAKNGYLPGDGCSMADVDLELDKFAKMTQYPHPWKGREGEYASILDIALNCCCWIGPCLTEILDAVKEAHDTGEPLPTVKILGIVGRYDEWNTYTRLPFIAEPR